MLISQMLRPNDLVRFQTSHYALAPIAGLQMEEGAVVIGDQMLVRCNRAEWETVERGYVFKDWHSQYYQANPVFLYQPFEQPIAPEEFDSTLAQLARDAARVVTACRLHKRGHLLEPIHTVRFLATGSFFHRAVSAYRTEYLAMPVDGMTWRLEASDLEAVNGVYAALTIMEQTPGTETLRSIVDQFNLSHMPTISSYFGIHVLLTGLEMLFGGLPKRLEVRTTHYQRALEIVRFSQGDELDPQFASFFNERVLELRNAVHHHALRRSNIDLQTTKALLQAPIQVGIRLLMRLHRPAADVALIDLKRDRGWTDLGPRDLLNACLDRYAEGDRDPLDQLLRFEG